MDRRPTLSLNEWAVLALLAEASRHGYDLAGELKQGSEVGMVWTVSRPVVYRALDRLEALELVTPRHSEPGHGPRRTVYQATRHGHELLRRWLVTPVEHVRDFRGALLLKLVIGRRLGVDPSALLAAQRETLAAHLAALTNDPQPGDIVGLWRQQSALAAQSFLDRLEETVV